MAVETEVKIKIDRLRKVNEIYAAIGEPDWQMQRNYLFSFGGNFLRIRYEAGRAFLTVKGENLGGQFISRQEEECEIPESFFDHFSRMCGASSPPVYYEKSRASARFMDCQVCLDNFFGAHYIEIEGLEQDIAKVIGRFELQDFPIEERSYLELLRCENGMH